MNLKKKIILSSLILTPTFALPLIGASCQQNSYVELIIPFKTDDARYSVFKEIVAKYNEDKDSKMMNVSVVPFNNSSTPFQRYIENDLEANNHMMPDLIFYYPSMANVLARYNKLINFKEEVKNIKFLEKLLPENRNLGIPNVQKDDKFLLPFGRSIDLLIINKFVFGFIFDKIEKESKKSLISPDKTKTKLLISIKDYFEKLKVNNADKVSALNNVLKFKVNNDYVTKTDFNFTDEIFTYSDKLENASYKLSMSFEKEIKKNIYPLYLSHTANHFFKKAFDLADGNFDNYMLKYGKEKENNFKLNYSNLKDKKSSLFKTFETIYNEFKELRIHDSIGLRDKWREKWAGHGYELPLGLNIMMTIISSHSYDSIFNLANEVSFQSSLTIDDFIFLPSPLKKSEGQKSSNFLLQGPSLMGVKIKPSREKHVKSFVKWLYNKKMNFNKTYQSDDFVKDITPIEYFNYKNKYIYPTQEYLNKFETIKNKQNAALISSFELFKEAIKNNDYHAFEEPVDAYSNRFRNDLELAMSYFLFDDQKNPSTNKDDFKANAKAYDLIKRMVKISSADYIGTIDELEK
ncbi:putative lipoprotein [Metamycoplasma subdolum]|uniref:Putative lipoprotein n=1 Tax=Metamycoplasma subdolum TaxID=92407 RepID=A0A3M0A8G0_9BACT|nr:hypothetical protein [Metamycoplasma subdolum]RMA79098.1 putative lipoprotein [Metamycoplasma subdolum]WPB50621.1 hypothetical protein R9C05_00465 [Metamycoplasma subdolum]